MMRRMGAKAKTTRGKKSAAKPRKAAAKPTKKASKAKPAKKAAAKPAKKAAVAAKRASTRDASPAAKKRVTPAPQPAVMPPPDAAIPPSALEDGDLDGDVVDAEKKPGALARLGRGVGSLFAKMTGRGKKKPVDDPTVEIVTEDIVASWPTGKPPPGHDD
jgi:hypothetical protein